MEPKIVSETKRYIECPNCGIGRHRIDHLFGGNRRPFGPWYCDECDYSYVGVVDGDNITIEKSSEDSEQSLSFLRHGDVILAVKGRVWDGDFDKEFFYTEHTCPTNYLGVEMVIDANTGDTDPHGIFEYLGTVPYVDLDEEQNPEKYYKKYLS